MAVEYCEILFHILPHLKGSFAEVAQHNVHMAAYQVGDVGSAETEPKPHA